MPVNHYFRTTFAVGSGRTMQARQATNSRLSMEITVLAYLDTETKATYDVVVGQAAKALRNSGHTVSSRRDGAFLFACKRDAKARPAKS